MTKVWTSILRVFPVLAAALVCGAAHAQPLTADGAVRRALERGSRSVQADANVLDARAGLYSAYSGVLPRFSASLTRSGSWVEDRTGTQVFGSIPFSSTTIESENYSTTPSVSGSWNVLNLSAISQWRSARSGLNAARHSRTAERQEIALATRRQFYEVVRAIKLADVASQSLRLAHDDERRVRALFDVGSVSRSDLLSAQVRTAQAQLDSLSARNAVTNQRILLADALGMPEVELGDVDTALVVNPRVFDEATVLAEAERARPDLQAAEAEVRAARSGVSAARFARLPYVTISGGADFSPRTSGRTVVPAEDTTGTPIPGTEVEFTSGSETDRSIGGSIALNWDFFDGLATDARNASARARLMRSTETRDALRRNLAAEVRQALLAHREALEREVLSRRALAAAEENLNLTQQKYNVGSATVLELIDAQVQLQRAQSDLVSALAAIRVAEAQVDRVRGAGE